MAVKKRCVCLVKVQIEQWPVTPEPIVLGQHDPWLPNGLATCSFSICVNKPVDRDISHRFAIHEEDACMFFSRTIKKLFQVSTQLTPTLRERCDKVVFGQVEYTRCYNIATTLKMDVISQCCGNIATTLENYIILQCCHNVATTLKTT